MEPNNRTSRPSRPDHHCEISSPVLRLLQVNDRGMVFESRTHFEIGDAIELGFHITHPVRPESDSGGHEQEFITGQGMVVGCRLCASASGTPIYEVTLLFSAITERDKRALSRYSNRLERSKPLASKSPATPSRKLIGLN